MNHNRAGSADTSPLFSLEAFAVIYDDQGRLLLCHHRDLDVWDFPGGRVESGELPNEAVIRQLKEKTSLEIEIIRLIGIYTKPGAKDLVFSFDCRVIAGEVMPGWEADTCQYFPLEKLPANTNAHLVEHIHDALHHLETFPVFRHQSAKATFPPSNLAPECSLLQDDFNPSYLSLVEPDASYKIAFFEMLAGFQSAGEAFFHDYTEMAARNFSDYIRFLKNQAEPTSSAAGVIPQSTYWLLHQNQKIYGVSRLRHSLSPSLDLHGGHISLAVQPTMRRKGLGTTCLRLTLQKARQLGLQRVLLTCDAGNLASIKMIRKCGGTLDHRDSEISHPSTYHFWINLD